MVTDDLLKEFKGRNHITHSFEDSDLKRLLSYSIAYVESRCGSFDVDGEEQHDISSTELVLERTRYAYNEALEYFEDNFLSEITALSIIKSGDSDEG